MAFRKLLIEAQVVADQQGRELVEVGKEAGAERDRDQIGQREEALDQVLNVLQAVETWVQTLRQEDAQLAQPALEIARQVKKQEGPRR